MIQKIVLEKIMKKSIYCGQYLKIFQTNSTPEKCRFGVLNGVKNNCHELCGVEIEGLQLEWDVFQSSYNRCTSTDWWSVSAIPFLNWLQH